MSPTNVTTVSPATTVVVVVDVMMVSSSVRHLLIPG
jgi:hypothetical protein